MSGMKWGKLHQIFGDKVGEQSPMRKMLIAVAGILFILVMFQTGWNKYTSLQQDLEDQVDLMAVKLEKQKRIVEQSQAYLRANQELKEFRKQIVSTRLLQGDTLALAEAKLQDLINEIAQEYNVNILSMRMLPRKSENIFSILQIGINGRAEIGAIKDFLAQIERDERFIYISELEIKIVNRREKRYFNLSAQITAMAYV